jgi:hypothetical protein
MGSTPDTTLGPRVFGADYFSNTRVGMGQNFGTKENYVQLKILPTTIIVCSSERWRFLLSLSHYIRVRLHIFNCLLWPMGDRFFKGDVLFYKG